MTSTASPTTTLAPWATCYRCQFVIYTDPERLLEVEARLQGAIDEFGRRNDPAGLAKAHRVRAGAQVTTRPDRRLRSRPLRGAHRGATKRRPPTDHRGAGCGAGSGAVGAEPRAEGRRPVSRRGPDAADDDGRTLARGDVDALSRGAGTASGPAGQGPDDAGRRPPGRRRPRPAARADGDRAVRGNHRIDGRRPCRRRTTFPDRVGGVGRPGRRSRRRSGRRASGAVGPRPGSGRRSRSSTRPSASASRAAT